MQDDSSAVAMTRWLCHATPGAIGRTTAAVGVFAGRHGSRPPMLEGVTAAVTEALGEIFDADTEVDVAADGAWLTVRLRGPGRWPAFATESRLRDLADRVELSADEQDDITVLLEFPSDLTRTDVRAASTPRTRPCRATALTRRAGAGAGAVSARRRPRC